MALSASSQLEGFAESFGGKIRREVRPDMDHCDVASPLVKTQKALRHSCRRTNTEKHFWWSDDIEDLRGNCCRWRRPITRERAMNRPSEGRATEMRSRKEH